MKTWDASQNVSISGIIPSTRGFRFAVLQLEMCEAFGSGPCHSKCFSMAPVAQLDRASAF